jgi:ribosomal protein S18 acetylase RimI-like enzyme
MSPALRIRPATPADVGAVRRLLVETWHDTYDPLLGRERVTEITNRWHAEDVLAGELDLPDSSFLIAERGGETLGHAFGRARQPPVLVVGRLYVRPAYQRQGIGGRLLAALLERHPETAIVRLTVEAANAKGISFYRRHGFSVVGEVDEDGLPALQMERALARDGARGP